MRIVGRLQTQAISFSLAIVLLAPPIAAADDAKGTTASTEQSQAAQTDPAGTTAGTQSASASELPDSPGATQSNNNPQPQPSSPPASNSRPPAQPRAQQPVGTAAADLERTTGVAAATPAGNAIAPSKQRRVRLLVLKVGAILGAGVAIGTVAALSNGSPSHPPGSH